MSTPTCGMGGGSRRRGAKSKKMRGGAMYGFGGALAGTTAGAQWAGVANDAVNPETGAPMPDYTMPGGRRRRRTGKKATRKGKKSRRVTRRRRTMRGGSAMYSQAGSRAIWAGDGSAGLPTFVSGNSNVPGAGHVQNADGAWSTTRSS